MQLLDSDTHALCATPGRDVDATTGVEALTRLLDEWCCEYEIKDNRKPTEVHFTPAAARRTLGIVKKYQQPDSQSRSLS